MSSPELSETVRLEAFSSLILLHQEITEVEVRPRG